MTDHQGSAIRASDDLEAVRRVAEILEPFKDPERERIIRWARERVGMQGPSASPPAVAPPAGPGAGAALTAAAAADIKTFITTKGPRGDAKFAAAVAYYHQFVAPESERKDHITSGDLVDACRRVDRERMKRPVQVLVDAFHAGLLDRAGRGAYKLNAVGENLVAMVLPEGSAVAQARSKVSGKKAPRKKRAALATRKPKSRGKR